MNRNTDKPTVHSAVAIDYEGNLIVISLVDQSSSLYFLETEKYGKGHYYWFNEIEVAEVLGEL